MTGFPLVRKTDRASVVDFLKEYDEFRPEVMRRELNAEPDARFIASIMGPRGSGKSYYLLSKRENRPNSLPQPQRPKTPRLGLRGGEGAHQDVHRGLRKGTELLPLDEVQNVRSWELAVRQLHDLKRYEMMLKGSSSKLLSKGLATQLRGRTLNYLLPPFPSGNF